MGCMPHRRSRRRAQVPCGRCGCERREGRVMAGGGARGAVFHAAGTTATAGTVERLRGRSRERRSRSPTLRRSGVCVCVCSCCCYTPLRRSLAAVFRGCSVPAAAARRGPQCVALVRAGAVAGSGDCHRARRASECGRCGGTLTPRAPRRARCCVARDAVPPMSRHRCRPTAQRLSASRPPRGRPRRRVHHLQ